MKVALSSALLLLALLSIRLVPVKADGAVNYLLKTNALNYQDNFEIDSEVHGHCIAGTPENNLKADAQTTRYDEKCKALVSLRRRTSKGVSFCF